MIERVLSDPLLIFLSVNWPLHDQIFFDKFLVSNVFLTVYITNIRNFRQILLDKCMCSKTVWLAFEQIPAFDTRNLSKKFSRL
jgi:hypothetical protein